MFNLFNHYFIDDWLLLLITKTNKKITTIRLPLFFYCFYINVNKMIDCFQYNSSILKIKKFINKFDNSLKPNNWKRSTLLFLSHSKRNKSKIYLNNRKKTWDKKNVPKFSEKQKIGNRVKFFCKTYTQFHIWDQWDQNIKKIKQKKNSKYKRWWSELKMKNKRTNQYCLLGPIQFHTKQYNTIHNYTPYKHCILE